MGRFFAFGILASLVSVPAFATIDGPLHLRGPETLVLGDTKNAEIVLDRTAGPLPLLEASVGSISKPTPKDEHTLQATFTPPRTRYPQLAILVARTPDGATVDWWIVRLHARPTVEHKTEPGARVSVELGGRTFGPVTADRDGKASLSVEAPPGVGKGVTIVTDELGNTKRSDLDLAAPDVKRVMAVCPDTGTPRVLLFAATSAGAPDASARFELSPSTLASPIALQSGVYTARLEGDYDVSKDTDVTARLQDIRSFTAKCTIRGGALPSDISVRVDRPEFVAGSGPVPVVVALAYPATKRRRDVEVLFQVDRGHAPGVTGSADELAAKWTLPDDLAGVEAASLRAKTLTEPVLEGKVALRMKGGALSTLPVSAERNVVGHRKAVLIRVAPADAFGNPVETKLEVEAAGEMSAFTRDPSGAYSATYTAPRLGTEDTIRIRNGPVESTLALKLKTPPKVGFLTGRAGVISNFGKMTAVAGSAGLQYGLPILERRVLVGIEAGGYSSRHEKRDSSGENAETLVLGVPVTARGVYRHPAGPVWIYGAAGGGVLFSQTEVNSASSGRVIESHPLPAFDAALGAEYELGPGQLMLEVGVLFADSKSKDVPGNIGGGYLTFGYRWGFIH